MCSMQSKHACFRRGVREAKEEERHCYAYTGSTAVSMQQTILWYALNRIKRSMLTLPSSRRSFWLEGQQGDTVTCGTRLTLPDTEPAATHGVLRLQLAVHIHYKRLGCSRRTCCTRMAAKCQERTNLINTVPLNKYSAHNEF
jgi:hypothetical protein